MNTFWRARIRFGPLALLFVTVAAPAQAQRRNPLAGLDQYIEKARQEWNVAGLAVAIVKDDSVIYAKGFGVREVGKPDPVDERTLFAIGSNTKAITAAEIGMLQEEGKLSLDDPVTKHVPYFELFDPYATREMTVRDLLIHRSGLPRCDMVWYASPFSRDEVIRRARWCEPDRGFRARFGYQNIMFITAGEVIEAASGMSWDEFTRRRFFEPLGMTASNTSVKELRGNVAQPHAKVDGKPVPIPWRDIDNAGPAGSINSNVVEMAQWLRTLIKGGKHGDKQIISENFLKEMLTPQMIAGTGMDTLMPMVHFDAYGLGFWLRDFYGRKLVMHGGGIDGMLSQFGFMPEEKVGAVVLTNTEGQNLQNALFYAIMERFVDVPRRDWSAIFLAQLRVQEQRQDSIRKATEAKRVAGTQPSLPLDSYVGTYDSKLYGEAKVTLEGGVLRLDRSPAFQGNLEHWHYDVFRAEWGHPRLGKTFVTFALDRDARVAKMNIDGLGDFERRREREEGAAGGSR